MNIEGYLSAHTFMQIERPPVLWEVDTEDVSFVRMLGEMIAVGLGRGSELEDLVLNASNVTVGPDAADESFPAGDYVAITVRGRGDWGAEERWFAGAPRAKGWIRCIDRAAVEAGAILVYSRNLGDTGSLTALLPRLAGSG